MIRDLGVETDLGNSFHRLTTSIIVTYLLNCDLLLCVILASSRLKHLRYMGGHLSPNPFPALTSTSKHYINLLNPLLRFMDQLWLECSTQSSALLPYNISAHHAQSVCSTCLFLPGQLTPIQSKFFAIEPPKPPSKPIPTAYRSKTDLSEIGYLLQRSRRWCSRARWWRRSRGWSW